MKKLSFLLFVINTVFLLLPCEAQLVDNGDGTVTDVQSGLMWLKDASLSGGNLTWQDALDWANNLVYPAGSGTSYDDWRLPSGAFESGSVCNCNTSYTQDCRYTEFGSLRYHMISYYNQYPFENITGSLYWTSSECQPDKAMAVFWEDPAQNAHEQTATLEAWAVRDADELPNTDIDVMIMDCFNDEGDVPSVPDPCDNGYTCPYIYIDNDHDNIVDPIHWDGANILKAVIRNKGSIPVNDVKVYFYYRSSSTGLVFPDGATLISDEPATIYEIPAHGYEYAMRTWYIPDPPADGGHWCIGVVVDHVLDPMAEPACRAPLDNNRGTANLWSIGNMEGEEVNLSFAVGTGDKSGFGFSMWPRDFELQFTGVLPKGWGYEISGVDSLKPFQLNLGETRDIKVSVQIPEGAIPREEARISFKQVDILTNQIVGSVNYTIYEDHHPAEKIDSIEVAVFNDHPILSWNNKIAETETGYWERIGYYEIVRDDVLIDEIAIDEDPYKEGFQWKEKDAVSGKVSYSVVVVDEAGNKSLPSEVVTVQVNENCISYCWICWVIVIILVIVLVILLLRKKK